MTPAEKRRVVKIVNANVKLRKRAALADKYVKYILAGANSAICFAVNDNFGYAKTTMAHVVALAEEYQEEVRRLKDEP